MFNIIIEFNTVNANPRTVNELAPHQGESATYDELLLCPDASQVPMRFTPGVALR